MKKMTTLLSLCMAIAFSSSLFALLPPLYQDIREITTMLSDDKIQNVLESGDRIVEIRKIDHGYQIVTNHCTVEAEIIHLPNETAGPSKFKVVFNSLSKS